MKNLLSVSVLSAFLSCSLLSSSSFAASDLPSLLTTQKVGQTRHKPGTLGALWQGGDSQHPNQEWKKSIQETVVSLIQEHGQKGILWPDDRFSKYGAELVKYAYELKSKLSNGFQKPIQDLIEQMELWVKQDQVSYNGLFLYTMMIQAALTKNLEDSKQFGGEDLKAEEAFFASLGEGPFRDELMSRVGSFNPSVAAFDKLNPKIGRVSFLYDFSKDGRPLINEKHRGLIYDVCARKCLYVGVGMLGEKFLGIRFVLECLLSGIYPIAVPDSITHGLHGLGKVSPLGMTWHDMQHIAFDRVSPTLQRYVANKFIERLNSLPEANQRVTKEGVEEIVDNTKEKLEVVEAKLKNLVNQFNEANQRVTKEDLENIVSDAQKKLEGARAELKNLVNKFDVDQVSSDIIPEDNQDVTKKDVEEIVNDAQKKLEGVRAKLKNLVNKFDAALDSEQIELPQYFKLNYAMFWALHESDWAKDILDCKTTEEILAVIKGNMGLQNIQDSIDEQLPTSPINGRFVYIDPQTTDGLEAIYRLFAKEGTDKKHKVLLEDGTYFKEITIRYKEFDDEKHYMRTLKQKIEELRSNAKLIERYVEPFKLQEFPEGCSVEGAIKITQENIKYFNDSLLSWLDEVIEFNRKITSTEQSVASSVQPPQAGFGEQSVQPVQLLNLETMD